MLAVFQFQPFGDPGSNLSAIARAAKGAASFGAALLVAPELALCGYGAGARFSTLAEPRNGPSIARLCAIAAEQKIAIAAGFAERDGADIFNTAILVSPSGQTQFYRKCHRYGAYEKRHFRPANALPQLFTLGGMTAAMLICYDVEFPEMARFLAASGADLLIVPTALPKGALSRRVSDLLVPARAMENQIFIAYAGLCGSENGFAYEGGSVIAAPDGSVLARAGREEALLIAPIVPKRYESAKAENPYWADRRSDLYAGFGPEPINGSSLFSDGLSS